jgi:coenzyme F420 biosynthesis associated uncharacterized protein
MIRPAGLKLVRTLAPATPLLLGAGYAVGRITARGLTSWLSRDSVLDLGLARRVAFSVQKPVPATFVDRGFSAAAGRDCADAIARTLDRPWSGDRRVHGIGPDEWLELNLRRFAQMLEPVGADHAPELHNPVARTVISVQLGLMLGYLSTRVLGQFDLPLFESGKGRTYLVEPNIHALARRLQIDPEQLWRWVAVHELTHALEFERAPWLAGYLRSQIVSFFSGADEPADAELNSGQRDSKFMWFALSGRQRQVVERIQACMSLLEGYSNLLMRQVGRETLSQWRQIDSKLRARDKSRSLITGIVFRVLGLGLKMEQYQLGDRFCQEIDRKYGREFLDMAWDSPERLPSLGEIAEPQRWAQRLEQDRSATRPPPGNPQR